MADEQPLTLGAGALARLTGVSTDTLRHYERRGPLPRPPRTTSGYRRYPNDAIIRARLIQRALVIGFSLEELARVLRERASGGAGTPPGERAYLLDSLAHRSGPLRKRKTLQPLPSNRPTRP